MPLDQAAVTPLGLNLVWPNFFPEKFAQRWWSLLRAALQAHFLFCFCFVCFRFFVVSPKGLGKELNWISDIPNLCDDFGETQLASWRNVWLPGRRIQRSRRKSARGIPASAMRLGLRPCECRRHRQARAGKQTQAAQAKKQPSTAKHKQAGTDSQVQAECGKMFCTCLPCLAWSPGHASAAGLGRSFGQRTLA